MGRSIFFRSLLLCFAILGLSRCIYSQSVANYSVVRSTGTSFSSIYFTGSSVPTWRNIGPTSQDDNRSEFINIGFDFWYDGTRYTQFSVSTNGFIDFSTSTVDGAGPNAFGYQNTGFSSSGSSTSTRPALAVFYDNITAQGGTDPLGTSLKYYTSGTAPYRVLTVEWNNMTVATNTTPSLTFQVKIYESTGVIEYNYGTMSTGTYAFSYTCGINAPTIGSFPLPAQLKTQQSANSSSFSNIPQNALVTLPASNSKITFTPPVPANPSGSLTFSSVTQTGMTLNWSNWATNEVGYAIYYSFDGVNYFFSTQTAANATSQAISGLWPGTSYSFKVYAVTEGCLSSALTGSQTTSAAGNKVSIVTSGNWNNAASWSPSGVPTASDNVTIQNGHTITINSDVNCNNLTVGGGSSGTLKIGNSTAVRNLNITGNITINSGASFSVDAASNATHLMTLYGKILNNGTLNFATDANSLCNVTFNRVNSQSVSGSAAMNKFNLVTVNIGSGVTDYLDITVSNFSAPANFLTLTKGVLHLNTTSAVSIGLSTTDLTIPSGSGLWLESPNVSLSTSRDLILKGYMRITSGTLTVGDATNENMSIDGGTLIIDGGNLNVSGRFSNTTVNSISYFTISGGQMKVPSVSSTSTVYDPFFINSPGTVFTMTGGTILIPKEGGNGGQNLGFSVTDVTNYTVTGGTLLIGDNTTLAGSTISINSEVPVGNFTVASTNATAYLLNDLTVNGNVSITSGSINANTSDMFVAGNWTDNGTFVPGTGTVTFSGSAATITDASGETFNNLVIDGSGTITTNAAITTNGNLTINSTFDVGTANNTIDVNGNWINNGTFVQRLGTVKFTGSVAQTVSTVNTGIFYNLEINNPSGVSCTSGSFELQSALTLNGGNFNIAGSSLFTMKSDATSTSRIAPVATGATVSGSMVIERFISARAAGYSDMSAPTTAATFQDWDDEMLLVYGYAPPSVYPSAWAYSESAWDYVPITSASTAITPGLGYEVYLDSYGTWTSFDQQTINSIGTPTIGTVNVSGSVTNVNDGWNLVGNPYASHLSLSSFYSACSQMGSSIMIYDESIEDFEVYSVGSGLALAPHQGFWIQVTGSSPTIQFTETAKSTSTSSTYKSAESLFRITLSADDSQFSFTSTTKFRFSDNASIVSDEGDISFVKVPHPMAPSFYSSDVNGKKLRINNLPAEDELNIILNSVIPADGFYTLTAKDLLLINAHGYSCIILEDRLNGNFIDLNSENSYHFYATTDHRSDRFILHLRKNSDCSFANNVEDHVTFRIGKDEVEIRFTNQDEIAMITLYNSVGQIIHQSTATGNKTISLPENSGMYIVEVRNSEWSQTHRVMVSGR